MSFGYPWSICVMAEVLKLPPMYYRFVWVVNAMVKAGFYVLVDNHSTKDTPDTTPLQGAVWAQKWQQLAKVPCLIEIMPHRNNASCLSNSTLVLITLLVMLRYASTKSRFKCPLLNSLNYKKMPGHCEMESS